MWGAPTVSPSIWYATLKRWIWVMAQQQSGCHAASHCWELRAGTTPTRHQAWTKMKTTCPPLHCPRRPTSPWGWTSTTSRVTGGGPGVKVEGREEHVELMIKDLMASYQAGASGGWRERWRERQGFISLLAYIEYTRNWPKKMNHQHKVS